MRTGTLLAAGLVGLTMFAQQDKLEFRVQKRDNQISPDEVIKNFEASAVQAYTLEPGDEITLEVWGHGDLSGKHILGPDGKITIPVAGVLTLGGLTREQAEKSVTTTLAKFYTDLAVTLRVDRYTSFRVYVLGRVANPGAVQFESQPTLLDVITRAGSLPIGGVGAERAALGRCAVIRGRDQMIWVDLRTLLTQGNLSLNIRLARNDLVYLPDAGDQLVYVLGQVQHPGAFRLTADMSFLDAFTQAGGVTDDAAVDKVELVRSSNNLQRQLALKQLLANPREFNFTLNEGDIIYVPKSGFGKIGYFLQKSSPITGFAVIGSALR
jgi:polysaccharide biosynthesis/export protein